MKNIDVPEPEDTPLDSAKFPVYRSVSRYITLDLVNPECPVGLDRVRRVGPAAAVPKGRVAEDGDLRAGNREIRATRHLLVLLAIANAGTPESASQDSLDLRSRPANARHVVTDLLARLHI